MSVSTSQESAQTQTSVTRNNYKVVCHAHTQQDERDAAVADFMGWFEPVSGVAVRMEITGPTPLSELR
jgi:hypothetical protein